MFQIWPFLHESVNKFASKLLFFLFLFIASINIFAIYNIIYVKLKPNVMYGHFVTIFNLSCLISLIILNAIRFTDQAHRNKNKLMFLISMEQLKINNKIKVIDSCFNSKVLTQKFNFFLLVNIH